jgi:hypothetical protein
MNQKSGQRYRFIFTYLIEVGILYPFPSIYSFTASLYEMPLKWYHDRKSERKLIIERMPQVDSSLCETWISHSIEWQYRSSACDM